MYKPSPDLPIEEREPKDVLVSQRCNTDEQKSNHVTYLGNTVTNTNSFDLEVERRIQLGDQPRSKFTRLLYATECITLYRNHIKKLTGVQFRHLRQILGIKWPDRVPSVEVLRKVESVSVEALITASQLRWIGQVRRKGTRDYLKKYSTLNSAWVGVRRAGKSSDIRM